MKRRLAQNREAARKSRQRRKDYVQKLEAEVRAAAWQPPVLVGKCNMRMPCALRCTKP